MGSRGDSTLGVVGVWECIGGERSLVLCLQCRVKYFVDGVGEGSRRDLHGVCALPTENPSQNAYIWNSKKSMQPTARMPRKINHPWLPVKRNVI